MDAAPSPTPSTISQVNPIVKGLFVVVVMFGVGFGGAIATTKLFIPPSPAPKPSGQLLGVIDEAATPAPTPTSTPNLTLSPEMITKAFEGSIAFLEDNQIYLIKADRTKPVALTIDTTQKASLTPNPDHSKLAYTYSSQASASGIAMVTISDKKITELVKPQEKSYSHLAFSPSGSYLSAWRTDGQEASVIDISNQKVVANFGTESQNGVSPMVWIPGKTAVSFVLENELFTREIPGEEIKSLAKKVVGIKTTPDNLDIPVPPVWSGDGRYVAYIKLNGVYVYDTKDELEIPIVKVDKDFPLDQLPYTLIGFNAPSTHVVFIAPANASGNTAFAYSLAEQKTVALGKYSAASLLDFHQNQLLHFNTRYSFKDWTESSCTNLTIAFDHAPTSALLDPTQPAFISVGTIDNVTIMSLVNTQTCETYDLLRTTNRISDPVWIH